MYTHRSFVRAKHMLALFAVVLFAQASFAQGPASAKSAPSSRSRVIPGRLLVGFRGDPSADQAARVVRAAGGRAVGRVRGGLQIVQLPSGVDAASAARDLSRRPDVQYVEQDRAVSPSGTPNDPGYGSEWHLPKISAPSAWDYTTGSAGVIVAILDTGVDGAHPDLSTKMTPGWNVYDGNTNTSDVNGHGTAVAGVAAAATNNALGVASVAHDCRIMPIRISGLDGWASYSAAAQGLRWAADNGARVANISYQMSESYSVQDAALYFQSKGGVVAISAGNSSITATAPDNPYVLTVSATDSGDNLASWSNRGSNIDVAAPGVSIYTTLRGGGYGSWNGTSFSAPVTAGVAALVIAANPGLSGAQALDIVKQSADDLGAAGWDGNYGAGRVNAARAVSQALSGSTPPPPPADTTAPAVSFSSPANGATVSGTVTVQVSASDNVGVASVTLSIDGNDYGTDSSAPYAFSWNTGSLGDGSHTLTATARDAAGNASSASITVTVDNSALRSAPAVTITSPTGGSVSGNVSVTVAVSASVVKVELYVDGRLTAASTSAPFTTRWNTRKASKGSHTLHCVAYDAAGAAATSNPVTVTK